MPDTRQHRGPHPGDRRRFAADQWPALQAATSDLSWLFEKGYALPSALKLVGDRYRLDARQRIGIARCAASPTAVQRRQAHQVDCDALRGQELWLDGYNVLTSLEAALGQGILLVGRDGCYRDMASMHGTYRKVAETLPAIQLLGTLLAHLGVSSCHWLLDRPVSNSGRLKTLLEHEAENSGWNWEVELVPDPDRVLIHTPHIVASSDSQIIQRADRWVNLARCVIERRVDEVQLVDLSEAAPQAPDFDSRAASKS